MFKEGNLIMWFVFKLCDSDFVNVIYFIFLCVFFFGDK